MRRRWLGVGLSHCRTRRSLTNLSDNLQRKRTRYARPRSFLENRPQSRPQATEYHLGLLKAKIARYRAQLLEPVGKSSGGGTGFDVQKSGDARVALIGFPSVGKACKPINPVSLPLISVSIYQSTLLSKCTHTASEAAAYEFTTLTVRFHKTESGLVRLIHQW